MNEFFYNFLFPFLACTSAVFVIIAFYIRRILQYQENKEKSLSRMACIARSRPVVLAMQFSRLHTFGMLYLSAEKRERENIRIKMSDYLKDTSRHLEDALQEDDGFEEGLFLDIVLEAAIEFNRVLKRIQKKDKGFDHILGMSSKCLEILRENGTEFVSRFNSQWEKIAGESNEN